jgi:predicted MPP superfamily phosphohydrolase
LSAMRWGRVLRDTLNCGILMNESVDCGPFVLVGIDDPVSGRENTAEAFKGVTHTKPVFVMSHFHPDRLLLEIEHLGADMVFSGHTHGGHIGIAAVVSLFPYANRSKYIAGLYRLNHTYLSVTRGVGTGIFPFRFLCRPEIVVCHLRGG